MVETIIRVAECIRNLLILFGLLITLQGLGKTPVDSDSVNIGGIVMLFGISFEILRGFIAVFKNALKRASS